MIWEQSKGREWADGIGGMQGIFVLKTYIQKTFHTLRIPVLTLMYNML